jgi:DNA-binding LytR/AlgR family response regulator
VVTSLGSELILMRLSDAERELAGVDGLRVHRSWWVSRKGIAESRREGGKIVLTLKSGDEVPVSRSYQDAVKDAGLVH